MNKMVFIGDHYLDYSFEKNNIYYTTPCVSLGDGKYLYKVYKNNEILYNTDWKLAPPNVYEKYFITFNEWRDKQLNTILND